MSTATMGSMPPIQQLQYQQQQPAQQAHHQLTSSQSQQQSSGNQHYQHMGQVTNDQQMQQHSMNIIQPPPPPTPSPSPQQQQQQNYQQQQQLQLQQQVQLQQTQIQQAQQYQQQQLPGPMPQHSLQITQQGQQPPASTHDQQLQPPVPQAYQPVAANVQATSSAYINNFVANQNQPANGNNATTSSAGRLNVVHMEEPKLKFDDCLSAERKAELIADFEEVKSMNLIDDPNTLYHIFTQSTVFADREFKMAVLTTEYRSKYSHLCSKYPSLIVFLDFCLSKIIYGSEAALKSACGSRTVRLPNTHGVENMLMMFGHRKRGAPTPIRPIQPIKKSTTIVHPFLRSNEYVSQPILYHIGRCCNYLIPAEFAELVATVQYEQVPRLANNVQKNFYMGLKVTLAKPIVCLLITKHVQSYHFISMEHLATLADRLVDMTRLGKLPDTFSYGYRVNLQVEEIAPEGRLEAYKHTDKMDQGFYVAVVNLMQICQLSNNTLSSKTYTNMIYSLPVLNLPQSKLARFNMVIEGQIPRIEAILAKYDAEVEAADKATNNDGATTSTSATATTTAAAAIATNTTITPNIETIKVETSLNSISVNDVTVGLDDSTPITLSSSNNDNLNNNINTNNNNNTADDTNNIHTAVDVSNNIDVVIPSVSPPLPPTTDTMEPIDSNYEALNI